MFEELKIFIIKIIQVSDLELELINTYFEPKIVYKKEYLLEDTSICDFLGFVAKGAIRHFHVRNGVERTCDISFENSWVTDFQSFTTGHPSIMNLQALEGSKIYTIQKKNLYKLYKECPIYETFGRLMAEQVAQRATEIAMSLSSEKPEKRFQNLLIKQPDLFQRVPQKYIANFLGVSPESLSRIQKRIQTKQKS